MKDNLIKP